MTVSRRQWSMNRPPRAAWPPVFTTQPATASVQEGGTIQFAAYDPNGGAIVWSLVSGPSGAFIDQTGLVTMAATPGSVVVRATGLQGLYIEATCVVTITTQAAWQLDSGHYVPTRLAPAIIHPRPDGETNAWERHRLAPSSVAWLIPIAVQGGAWPFRYTVDATSAAKGITIGETYGSAGYGVLSWASPTVGSHTITVTVYTQEYGRNTSGMADTLTRTFTLVVADKADTTKFLWVDAINGNDSTGTGSPVAPYKTFAKVQSVWSQTKQVFWRAGTYAVTTGVVGQPINMATGASLVHVGYPGETVTWSQQGGDFLSNVAGGCYFGNLNFTGSNLVNYAEWWTMLLGQVERFTFFASRWHDIDVGGGNVSWGNEGGLTGFATVIRRYISVINCKFERITNIQNGAASVLYSSEYVLYEGNVISGIGNFNDSEPSVLIAKGRNGRVTFRNNRLPDNNLQAHWILNHWFGPDGGEGVNPPDYAETCWNYVRNPISGCAAPFGVNAGSAWNNAFLYRNTLVSRFNYVPSYGRACTLGVDGNVMITDSGLLNDAQGANVVGLNIVTSVPNILATNANVGSVIDQNGYLLDSCLAAKGIARGSCGHEVSGVA